jgi:hypothetical protein
MEHVYFRLAILLVLLIIGVSFYFIRKWSNKRALKQGQSVQEHFKNTIDPAAIGENISWLIFNKTIGTSVVTSEIRGLKENDRLGKMKILVNKEIEHLKFLVATICEDEDYDMNVIGKFGSVKKQYQFNFIVELIPEENTIRIFSERFDDLNNKNLRTDFALRLVQMCTASN